MSIHKGDGGETALGNNERVFKDNLRLEVCGELDELSAVLGVVRAENLPEDIQKIILRIQSELLLCGAEIAECPVINRLTAGHVQMMDEEIADREEKLPPNRGFILAGENRISALFHWARTVCRRTERSLVKLSQSATVSPFLLQYINRLSSLLFILARAEYCQALLITERQC